MKVCKCGQYVDKFGIQEFSSKTWQITGLRNGLICCSTFSSYQLTKQQAQEMIDEFNNRDNCDLGIESGIFNR